MKQFFKMVFASCFGVILASSVVMILFFATLGVFIANVSKSFTSSSSEATVKPLKKGNNILSIDLKGALNDGYNSETVNDLVSFNINKKSYTLREVLQAIEEAKTNASIDAILLKMESLRIGFESAQELRDKLLEFKESGKPIYAYADRYSYGNYFVSSVADKIYMNPEGMVLLQGLSSVTQFIGGPLKKLGVEMQVFKVGAFKGAVEPYVNRALSPENRLQIETFLGGLWQSTTEQIALSRGIARDSIVAFANEGDFFGSATNTVQKHLVDSLFFETDLKKVIANKVYNDEETEYNEIEIGTVLKAASNPSSSNKIALVVAEGNIVNIDEDENPFATNGPTIGRSFITRLRELADDDDVKAVVMRVNSPGGDAFLSELILNEVRYVKSKKPIVVSMGNYAASGGYYISAEASKIYAGANTLTGSIGIFGVFPNFAGTAAKIDLTTETVKTAALADLGNAFRPMTEQEKQVIQNYINRGYDTFITRVSDGRHLSKEEVNQVAQGRVWLGSDALQLKLVDAIGSLQDAIEEAARLAGLDSYQVGADIKPKGFVEKLLNMSSTEVKSFARRQLMSSEELYIYEKLLQLKQQSGVMAVSPLALDEINMNSPKLTITE